MDYLTVGDRVGLKKQNGKERENDDCARTHTSHDSETKRDGPDCLIGCVPNRFLLDQRILYNRYKKGHFACQATRQTLILTLGQKKSRTVDHMQTAAKKMVCTDCPNR